MGLLDLLFPKKNQEKEVEGYFKTFNGYTPSFTSFGGGLYEMDLTRSAIHAFASQVSKLKPEVTGSAMKRLEKQLQYKPNPYMDTSKFLYRLATILSVHNTAFILPLYDDDYETIIGFYPLLPTSAEIVEVRGQMWFRYQFANGEKAAIEYDRVGVLTQYQFRDDFFGESNEVMDPTMQLMDIQNQGMQDAIKQSAAIRFMAKLGSTLRPDDLEKEQQRFSKQNLSYENTSGVMMFDAKYSDVQQINSKAYVVDAEQMKVIQNNVFNYFGVNEDILQNKFNEDTWNAYYEGKIEPFALQLGLVMSNMVFTNKELAFGNGFMFTANRMQYASNKTKLEVSTQLFDRGILSTNDVMDIWNLPHVEGGERRRIRLEYTDTENLDKGVDDKDASRENERIQEPPDIGAESDAETD